MESVSRKLKKNNKKRTVGMNRQIDNVAKWKAIDRQREKMNSWGFKAILGGYFIKMANL